MRFDMTQNLESTYPHLLIITRKDILNDTDSTSVTIRSFLGEWPVDKLSMICCEDFNAGQSGRMSESCYRLTNSDVLLGSILFKTNNRKSYSAVGTHVASTNNSLKSKIKYWFKHYGLLLYTCLPYKRSKELESFIDERRPEVIYTNFTNLRMLRLVNKIAKRYDLPLVPHFFDDWLSVYFESGSFGHFYFEREIKRMFESAPATLCISPKMCEAYKQRYHLENAYPLLNSVEPRSIKKIKNEDVQYVIFFAGSLYLGRQETILALCDTISRLQKDVCLQICAPQAQWDQFSNLFDRYDFVDYCGYLNSDGLNEKIVGANCLLFVESFDEKYLKYTSLSLSTRVPEYLSTGVPIMALGNRQQGSLEYLANNNAAYVAFEKKGIPSCLEDVTNHTKDAVVIESAKKLFVENHLRSKQESRFLSIIKSAKK